MDSVKLRPAILVISDTAAHDPSTDKAGTTLSDVFRESGADRWTTPDTRIVPDDVSAMQRAITQWCDSGEDDDHRVNLIVTTGGTGFAVRDHTPEAVSPLLHRHASGLVYVGLRVLSLFL